MLTTEKTPPVQHFDARELRSAFGRFTTGVVVVTTLGEGGRKIGVTANSFTSVSLDPALILWCPSKTSRSYAELMRVDSFAINVLGEHQAGLSKNFAGPSQDKFADVEYATGLGGVPLLDGAVATFECRTFDQHDAGDHAVILGQVERFTDRGGDPLVFHSGQYARLG